MSMAEIKQEISKMTDAERREISQFLRSLSERDDPEWAAELDARCDRVLRGEGYGVEELTAIHERKTMEGK